MDYIKPSELIADSLQAAEKKACLPVRDLFVRGFLAGSFLGFATSLTIIIRAQGLPPFVGAAVFPVGFVLLVLLFNLTLSFNLFLQKKWNFLVSWLPLPCPVSCLFLRSLCRL